MAIEIKSRWFVAGMVMASLAVSGCALDQELASPHPGNRAAYGDEAVVPEVVSTRPAETTPPGGLVLPPPAEIEARGTYTYTVPETVTRVERTTGTFDQAALYEGQPAPGDTPFLVITVGPEAGKARQANPLLQPTKTRRYSMNGLVVDEWTGYTQTAKMPFAELLVRHPGGGDELFAVAIARDDAQRKLAESILGSIRWTAD